MSEEVRALLGPVAAARVEATPLAGGHCPVCADDLNPDGPATVLLLRSPHVTNAAFAHPRCVPSAVIDVSDDAMAAGMDVAEEEGTDMNMTAALVEHGRAMLPCLLAEPQGFAYGVQGPAGQLGEMTDLMVSTVLGRGLALVARLREAPRHAAGWGATLAPGLDGWFGLEVTDPSGGIMYVGTVKLPDGWQQAARIYGWCVLYVGGFRLPAGAGDTMRALRDAARAGELAGGRMPVTWRAA